MAVTQDWDQSGCIEGGVATLRCIPVVLQNIINFLVIFAGVIAVFFIVFSGIRFVTSGGDPEKIASARKILTYAIIGFIIVVFSFVILNLIAQTTGVTQLTPK